MTSAASAAWQRIQVALFGPAIGKSGWIVSRYRGVSMISIPGAASLRWWLANSRSACDTARMSTLSRALQSWDPIRVAAVVLGVALVILLAGYVVAAAASQPTLGGVVSALALLAIAGSGLLYAWRLEAGGSVD
jgi:hypothetical protein